MNERLFRVMFDTGSCELWVAGTKSGFCEEHSCLDAPSEGSTGRTLYIEVSSRQYISGSVEGTVETLQVGIGDLRVEGQAVGVANRIEIPLFQQAEWDGIVGLAYPNAKVQESGIWPLMDTLMRSKALEQDLFTYYTNESFGAITFGGVNYAHTASKEALWVPLLEPKYWTLQLVSVLVGDYPLTQPSPRPVKAIIDTGTFLIYGPAAIMEAILTLLESPSCDIESLPTLTFVFQGETELVDVALEPKDYVLRFETGAGVECVTGLAADYSSSDWTLGQVFLSSYVSVFDRKNDRIGFLPKAPSSDL